MAGIFSRTHQHQSWSYVFCGACWHCFPIDSIIFILWFQKLCIRSRPLFCKYFLTTQNWAKYFTCRITRSFSKSNSKSYWFFDAFRKIFGDHATSLTQFIFSIFSNMFPQFVLKTMISINIFAYVDKLLIEIISVRIACGLGFFHAF